MDASEHDPMVSDDRYSACRANSADRSEPKQYWIRSDERGEFVDKSENAIRDMTEYGPTAVDDQYSAGRAIGVNMEDEEKSASIGDDRDQAWERGSLDMDASKHVPVGIDDPYWENRTNSPDRTEEDHGPIRFDNQLSEFGTNGVHKNGLDEISINNEEYWLSGSNDGNWDVTNQDRICSDERESAGEPRHAIRDITEYGPNEIDDPYLACRANDADMDEAEQGPIDSGGRDSTWEINGTNTDESEHDSIGYVDHYSPSRANVARWNETEQSVIGGGDQYLTCIVTRANTEGSEQSTIGIEDQYLTSIANGTSMTEAKHVTVCTIDHDSSLLLRLSNVVWNLFDWFLEFFDCFY